MVFDRVMRKRDHTDDVPSAPTVVGFGSPMRSRPQEFARRIRRRLNVDTQKLSQIYAQSDSEDEEIKQTSLSHATNGLGQYSSTKFHILV